MTNKSRQWFLANNCTLIDSDALHSYQRTSPQSRQNRNCAKEIIYSPLHTHFHSCTHILSQSILACRHIPCSRCSGSPHNPTWSAEEVYTRIESILENMQRNARIITTAISHTYSSHTALQSAGSKSMGYASARDL